MRILLDVKIYKCFIASPSDTQKERDACDDVFQLINESLGQQLNFRLESRRWEKDARPSFGEDGQSVITEQLLDNYQLFIGIMCNKFGSPTKRAESGSEEEFNHAYNRHLEGSDVEIMLYFNNEPVATNTLDLDQLRKVRAYQEKVTELGALYSSYTGVTDFKAKLTRHLNDYFVSLLQKSSDDPQMKVISKKGEAIALRESVSLILQSRLSEALCLFSNQPIVWVEPIVSETNQISMNADENYDSRVDIADFVDHPRSVAIKAPPQFGLTCLALSLCKMAWESSSFWVYLDADKVRREKVSKSVVKEAQALNLGERKIDCIVLDSWNIQAFGAKKLLRNLCNEYRDIPIVVMQTITDIEFSDEDEDEDEKVKISRSFSDLHLLALPRSQIRKVVAEYNDEKNIGEEDSILGKVISDLTVLNVHRTPQNCLMLLKVAEKHFDESPVNRTKMIEMVLFVLFDMNELPNYASQPDVKDCEYVLGCFCESLLRNDKYGFTRDEFLKGLDNFCKEKLIHLEVSVVFDILYKNNILIEATGEFTFRSTYWVYYFAATRMYLDEDFCNYILNEKPYPEIIEFYTGIDRNREDLLKFLEGGLATICSLVEKKTGLPDEVNPLKDASWSPTEETVKKMQDEVGEDVLTSNLPDAVKDRYADTRYDQRKPYDQTIRNIFTEYSMVTLKNQIMASSRALRNSDYVDPDVKRRLLYQIIRGWKIWSKILFAMGPLLAAEGRATFDGQLVTLVGDFGETEEKRLNSIFLANPFNVVNSFKDDLYSQKIGPLLYDAVESQQDDMALHLLMLLITNTRPQGWKKPVEHYIESLPSSSFYLCDLVASLNSAYQFDFGTDGELREIAHLIKKSLAKHEFDKEIPDLKDIKRISNSNLPTRSSGSSE